MKFEIDRLDSGSYQAREFSDTWETVWTSAEVSRGQLCEMLKARGHHPRDVFELLESAESQSRETHARANEIARIWRASMRGGATSADVDFVRSELRDDTTGFRKTDLAQILYRTGHHDEAERDFVEILERSTREDDLDPALSFLGKWFPLTFARVGRPFIRGTNSWKGDRGVRAAAMSSATDVLFRHQLMELFDDIASVARDAHEDWLIRMDASIQIARLAEGSSADLRVWWRDDQRHLEEDIARAARSIQSRPEPSEDPR